MARLRRAWKSLRQTKEEQEAVKRKGVDETDLDILLPQPELDTIAARHWARYKLTWPPDIQPSDLLISRVTKEVEKRVLSVRDVTKVKTVAQMQRASRKRLKIADSIEIVQGEMEQDPDIANVHAYTQALQTLLIAYSYPGSKQLANAPTSEPKGTDTTKVVECPLDVLWRYYHRVCDRASRLPYGEALEWVRSHDESERALWVDLFRNSQDSLGMVVQRSLLVREAMWEIPPRPPRQGANVQRAALPNAQQGKQGQQRLGQPAKMAKAFKDGTKLCQQYQRGACKSSSCRDKHACAAVLRTGRVCGGMHPAKWCTNKAANRRG